MRLPRDTGSMRCRAETRGKAARQPEREENGDGGYRRGGRGGRRRRAACGVVVVVLNGTVAGGSIEKVTPAIGWLTSSSLSPRPHTRAYVIMSWQQAVAGTQPRVEGAIHMKKYSAYSKQQQGAGPSLGSRVPSQLEHWPQQSVTGHSTSRNQLHAYGVLQDRMPSIVQPVSLRAVMDSMA
ncbi:hypothetical protein CIHG_02336 [Coccidioides immitis H538.4]|uniref:Uncharacterized protein n=1 Tax=Coccidioides immitis H538.4 TaxID=396776 RepID=A0A0J8UBQ6_COCIT|nr:hypothetical protein CIHG_02336 [Coccidioides immitis H538.4]